MKDRDSFDTHVLPLNMLSQNSLEHRDSQPFTASFKGNTANNSNQRSSLKNQDITNFDYESMPRNGAMSGDEITASPSPISNELQQPKESISNRNLRQMPQSIQALNQNAKKGNRLMMPNSNQSIERSQASNLLESSLGGINKTTLKGRLKESMRMPENTMPLSLTKDEVMDLQRMNDKRQMCTLLNRTSGQNNHLKYLSGRLRTNTNTLNNSTNRLNSRSKSKNSKQRLSSAQSGKASSSGERQLSAFSKHKMRHDNRSQRQSFQLVQSYASTHSSRVFHKRTRLNLDHMMRPTSKKTTDPMYASHQMRTMSPAFTQVSGVMDGMSSGLRSSTNRYAEDKKFTLGGNAKSTTVRKVKERIQSAQNFSKTMNMKRRTVKLPKENHFNQESNKKQHLIQTGNVLAASKAPLGQNKGKDLVILRAEADLEAQAKRLMENYNVQGQLYTQQAKAKPTHAQTMRNTIDFGNSTDKNQGLMLTQLKDSALRQGNTTYLTQATTMISQQAGITTGNKKSNQARNLSSEERQIFNQPLGSTNVDVDVTLQNHTSPQTLAASSIITQAQIMSKEMEITGANDSLLTDNLPHRNPTSIQPRKQFSDNEQYTTAPIDFNGSKIQFQNDQMNLTGIQLNNLSSVTSQRNNEIKIDTNFKEYHLQSANIPERVLQFSGQSEVREDQLRSVPVEPTYDYSENKPMSSLKQKQYSKVREIYEVPSTNFNKQSSIKKAPHFQITELKNQIVSIQKSSEIIRTQIENVDDQFKKINKGTKYLYQRANECKADKLEILRDLSQYEFNYSKEQFNSHRQSTHTYQKIYENNTPDIEQQPKPKLNFKSKLAGMVDKIKKGVTNCQKVIKFDEEGQAYFTQSNQSFEFMHQNFNHLLTGQGQNLKTSNSASFGHLNSQMTKVCDRDSQMNINEMGLYKEMTTQTQSDLEHDQKRRWLDISEMNHLRGCLLRLHEIKNFRQSSALQSSMNLDRFNSPIGIVASPDIREINQAPVGTSATVTTNQWNTPTLPDEHTAPWARASERRGCVAINNLFNSLNSWEAANKVTDNKKTFKDHYDQTLVTSKYISGMPCKVVAYLLNGSIDGQVSLLDSDRCFQFKMTPSLCKDWVSDVKLDKEIQRLTLDYVMDEQHFYNYQLNISNDSNLNDIPQNFIISIQGSQNPKNLVYIQLNDTNLTVTVTASIWQIKSGKNPDTKVPKHHVQSWTYDFEDFKAYLTLHLTRLSPVNKSDQNDNNSSKTSDSLNEDSVVLPSQFPLTRYASLISQEMCFMLRGNQELALMFKERAKQYYRLNLYPQILTKYLLNPINEDNNDQEEMDDMAKSSRREQVQKHGRIQSQNVDGAHASKLKDEKLKKQVLTPVIAQRKISVSQESPGDSKKLRKMLSSIDKSRESEVGVNDEIVPNLQLGGAASRKSSSNHAPQHMIDDLERIRSKFLQINLTNSPQRNNRASMLVVGHGALTKLQVGRFCKTSVQKQKDATNKSEKNESMMIHSLDSDGQELFKKLRQLKVKQQSDLQKSEEEDQMEQYEYLYGVRLAKAHKKFVQAKQQHKIDQDFEKEKTKQETQVIQRILGQQVENLSQFSKNRINSRHNKPKRKYFRRPRIYQNGYVAGLFAMGSVLEFRTIPEKEDPEFEIMMIFFTENNSINLLLGRDYLCSARSGKRIPMYAEQVEQYALRAQKKSSQEVTATLTGTMQTQTVSDCDASSHDLNAVERDDDSPFFVKIILDSEFLSLLEDANLTEPAEIMGPPNRIIDICENKVYQDIIQTEVFKMYYTGKKTSAQQNTHVMIGNTYTSLHTTTPNNLSPPETKRNKNSSSNVSEQQIQGAHQDSNEDYNLYNNQYEVINEEETSGAGSKERTPDSNENEQK